jgi:DNA-binding NarL/FixJ family response regulator
VEQAVSTSYATRLTRSNDSILSSRSAQISVYIFDSSQLNCDLLSQAAEGSQYGLKVIGCANNAAGIQSSLLRQTDVAIIGSRLKDGPLAGFTLLKQVSKTHASLRCVMLLDQDRYDFVVEAFRSGAVGVCERNQSSEMLCKCIYCVHNGQVWVNNEQLHYLLEAVASNGPIRLTDLRGDILLSDREEEIARLVAEAFTNREIAEHLKITERTVKNHMNHIFDRLGLSNRVELTRYALAQRSVLKYPASVNPSRHGTRIAS